jgi:hypothetical protein
MTYVGRVVEMTNYHEILVGNPEGNKHSEVLGVDGSVTTCVLGK